MPSRSATKADLEGASICFLLEIKDHKSYRFSSFPISLFDGAEELRFDGELGDPEFELAVEDGFNIESQSIPLELVFTDRDLAKEYMRGFELEYLEAELSYCTVKDGSALQAYDNRVLIFKGRISQPLIGDPSKPVGYVSFSLENGRELQEYPLIDPDRVLRGDIPSRGKIAPVIIGAPCLQVPNDGGTTLSNLYTSPAYLTSTSSSYALIASHFVEAATVDIKDQDGKERTGITVSNVTSVLTGTQARVTLTDGSGDTLITGDGSDFELWVKWDDGGGHNNPFGEGLLQGAGDVVRYALSFVNAFKDNSAFEALAPHLNSYKIDGWINEEVEALEWLEASILPYIPLSIQVGPFGLYPILDLHIAATIQAPVAVVEDGVDFYVTSGFLPLGDPEDIINRLILKFAWSGDKDAYGGLIEIDPRVELEDHTATKFSSLHSRISFNRFGLRTKILEADFISDFTTASRVAMDLIHKFSYPRMAIEVEANFSWGWLDIGDLIQITSSKLHLTNEIVQVVKKSYLGASWSYQLLIHSDPIKRTRP